MKDNETMKPFIIIRLRTGMDAQTIADFLERHFQRPGSYDDGSNPLVNAAITVVKPSDSMSDVLDALDAR